MKSYVINRNSWHYKLVRFIDPMIKYDDESNLCSYTRQVLMGMFLVSLISIMSLTILGFLLYTIGDTIGYIVAGLMMGEFEPFVGPPVATATLASFALIFWTAPKLRSLYNYLRSKRKPKNQQEGFVAKAYSSWKEKTCSKITFEKSE